MNNRRLYRALRVL